MSLYLSRPYLSYSLLEHLHLAVHQLHKYLVFLNLGLLDDLDGAGDVGFEVMREEDLAEGALAQEFNEAVVVVDVAHALHAFEVFEGEQLPVGRI